MLSVSDVRRGAISVKAGRTALILALVAGLLLTPASVLAERTIGLSTGTIELALAPGQAAQESVRLFNSGDESLRALIYTSDVQYDEEGLPTYTRPTGAEGEYLRSPASWLRLRVPDTTKIVSNTPYIEMQPGDEFQVSFDLVVPKNATPGDYNSIIFFEMFEFADDDEGAISRISGRIGARVRVRVVGDVVDKVELTPFKARTLVIGDMVPYTFQIKNDGNIDKSYSAVLQVLGSGESVVLESQVASEAVVYARGTREHADTLVLEGVGVGRYTLRAKAEYLKETGPEPGTVVPEELVFDRTIWVVPLWMAIAFIVVFGALALWISWKMAKKRLTRPASDDGEERSPKRKRESKPRRRDLSDERRLARERAAQDSDEETVSAPETEDYREPGVDEDLDEDLPHDSERPRPARDIWVPDDLFGDRSAAGDTPQLEAESEDLAESGE